LVEFLTTPTDTIAVIDGALPNTSEWSTIARENVLVNVLSMPGRADSLAPIVPFAGFISRLAVNSSTCTDLRDLESFPDLTWLLVGGVVRQHPNPAALRSLERFGGDPHLLPGIIGLSSIAWLKIKWHAGILDAVSESTTDLTLTEAGRLESFAGIDRLKNLRSLTIHGARNLSLSGLRRLEALEVLVLHTAKRTQDISEILHMPRLSAITLDDCPVIDQVEAGQCFVGKVSVIGRNPVTAFRTARSQ